MDYEQIVLENYFHRAVKMAISAHKGQKRKFSGEGYVEHPRRVAASFSIGTIHAVIAWLHDVVEDCADLGYTLALIRDEFDGEVAQIISALTKGKNEPYMDYIKRLCKNKIAYFVKTADLEDNMSDLDFNTPLMDKYLKAVEYMRSDELRETWEKPK